ncbi:MAG: hypothetical protein E7395_04890 [Ruminococcaceae bacterium]|nr:hypothetical protein [Oscillospiraceae bacterium]
MSTYFDKKKLIENNSDLYISEYDKSLDTTSLAGIIDAKRSYANAEKLGDSAGMSRANQTANNIRKQSGSYDGGFDGSEYNRAYKPYEVNINYGYTSPYAKKKEYVLSLISDYDDFSYDYQKDPVFDAYRKLYTRLGEEAYERALYSNALRTGGTLNTSAVSAAMQAKNKYNSMLTDKIPELYEAAYERYVDKYNRLYDQLKALSDLDEVEYTRYRDTIDDFNTDREYFSNIDEQMRKEENDRYEFDTEIELKDKELAREMAKDRDENLQWAEENRHKAIDSAVKIAKVVYGNTPAGLSVINDIVASLN